jgi:hypothetical protein
MVAFPVLSQSQDSKYYKPEQEDPAIRNPIEGGYVATRPRFTRPPRKSFTTGFSDLLDSDRATLMVFWDTVMGGSNSFTWVDPITNNIYQVRFAEQMDWRYSGVGATKRWDVTMKLEQV